jgi:hypothetical protein
MFNQYEITDGKGQGHARVSALLQELKGGCDIAEEDSVAEKATAKRVTATLQRAEDIYFVSFTQEAVVRTLFTSGKDANVVSQFLIAPGQSQVLPSKSI